MKGCCRVGACVGVAEVGVATDIEAAGTALKEGGGASRGRTWYLEGNLLTCHRIKELYSLWELSGERGREWGGALGERGKGGRGGTGREGGGRGEERERGEHWEREEERRGGER